MENVKIDSILLKMNPYLPKMLLYLPKTGEKVSNLEFYAPKFRLVSVVTKARLAGQKAQLALPCQKAGSGASLLNMSGFITMKILSSINLIQFINSKHNIGQSHWYVLNSFDQPHQYSVLIF